MGPGRLGSPMSPVPGSTVLRIRKLSGLWSSQSWPFTPPKFLKAEETKRSESSGTRGQPSKGGRPEASPVFRCLAQLPAVLRTSPGLGVAGGEGVRWQREAAISLCCKAM